MNLRPSLYRLPHLAAALAVLSALPAFAQLPPARTGDAYVSSYGTDEIYCFDASGRYKFHFDSETLDGPRGIAITPEGELFVSSQRSHRVIVFDLSGSPKREIQAEGFSQPTGLAFSPEGDLYVSSFDRSEVFVFAGEKLVRTVSHEDLRGANCVAFAASGDYYVASQSNSRILHFDAAGEWQRTFTGGNLRSAMGIAVYEGKLYATGGASNTVAVFSLGGEFQRNIDTGDTISGPQGIAFDDRGRFTIASFYTGKVATYPIAGDSPQLFDSPGLDVARSIAYVPLEPLREVSFQRGDFNRDFAFNISDPLAILGFLFSGVGDGLCRDAGDINDDGKLNIADATRALGYLFGDGPPPEPPFSEAGDDPTPDELRCYAAE